MSINHFAFSGNLVKDAEVRRTAGGTSITSFTIAVNERRKNGQTGEWEKYANYFDLTWFGDFAEKCAASLVKGAPIAASGKVRQSRWQNAEGQNRSKVDFIVDEVQLPPRQQQSQFIPPATANTAQVPRFEEVYDDIPF